MFYTSGPNLVILVWMGDDTQIDGHTVMDNLRQTYWDRQADIDVGNDNTQRSKLALSKNKFKSKMHIWFPQNSMEEAQGRADALQQLLQEDGQRRSVRRVLSEDARFR